MRRTLGNRLRRDALRERILALWFEGATQAEIVAKLGISIGTIQKIIHEQPLEIDTSPCYGL